MADPWSSNRANVDGTLRVLIAARDAKVKRVVYAPSSSALGSAYIAEARRETVCLRYFNVFGPRQDPTSPYSAVLAKFITMMLKGEQPTVFGDGEQSRDFTYIDNCVHANLKACDAPADSCVGRVFNVACGQRVTLNETYSMLESLIGFERPPLYIAERSGDIKHSLADIAAAKAALGYEPIVDFEEGLGRTISWYKGLPKAKTACAAAK